MTVAAEGASLHSFHLGLAIAAVLVALGGWWEPQGSATPSARRSSPRTVPVVSWSARARGSSPARPSRAARGDRCAPVVPYVSASALLTHLSLSLSLSTPGLAGQKPAFQAPVLAPHDLFTGTPSPLGVSFLVLCSCHSSAVYWGWAADDAALGWRVRMRSVPVRRALVVVAVLCHRAAACAAAGRGVRRVA